MESAQMVWNHWLTRCCKLLLLLVGLWGPAAAQQVDRVTPDLGAAPPRGVWIAGPQHNKFWQSRETIRAELDAYKAAGLNTVYPVVWMQGRSLFPSAVAASITGKRQLSSLGERDALREILDEAKPLGIRVVAWLEFGFASHHEGAASTQELAHLKPNWVALNAAGKPVVKNGFHWLNAFDADVQRFAIDLSVELARNYPDLHGVQGDDRLPALPSEGGYNSGVRAAYAAEHGGKQPPTDGKDAAWVQWRADRLTAFLRQWRSELKAVNPKLVLSSSPSPYPWGLQEYLQDWPRWLREGLIDEALPQLYRRDVAGYQRLVDETLALVDPANRSKVFPGMLLALGPNVIPSETVLAQWIAATRAAGFGGEVYFHSTGVERRADVLRKAYGVTDKP